MKTNFRRIFAVIKISFIDIMSYKMNMVSIIASHILDLGLTLFLWTYILRGGLVLNGYTINSMYVYMSLAVVLNSFFNTPRRLPATISNDVINGTIAAKIIYPMNYYNYNLFYCIGRGMFFFLFVGLPLMIISMLLLGTSFSFPLDFLSLLRVALFVVSVLLGYLLETCIALVVSGIVFWTEKSGGLISAATFLAYLFSGRLIPIDFFPKWLAAIVNILPYKYVIYAPISIYLGNGNPFAQIAGQLCWLFLLFAAGKFLFSKAYARIEIAGG